MNGLLSSTIRRSVALLAAFSVLLAALAGCASGPRPLDVVIPGIEDAGAEVRVVEYQGSNAGEPVPDWLTASIEDLQARPEFGDSYVFRFSQGAGSLADLQAGFRSFPESRSIAAGIIERALAKVDTIDGVPDDLMDRAVRIVAAAEYAGTDRKAEFWVHEELLAEETTTMRHRGWLLYSVPRDQVFAGLVFAWENASASFPPATEPELRACEALQALFVNGL